MLPISLNRVKQKWQGGFARYRIHVDIEKKHWLCFLLQETVCWVLPVVHKSPTTMAFQSVRMVTVAARPR